MPSSPPGDRHRIDHRREHRVDGSDDERFDERLAYAGETLDAPSTQVRVHMRNPPKAQEGGTVLADGGSKSERSDQDDDQQDGSEENDSSGDGSSVSNVHARTSKVSPDLESGDVGGSSDTAGHARGAPRGTGETWVGA